MAKQVQETREFMGEEIRVVFIDKEMYVVMKDVFQVLGRLDRDGNWNYSKGKVETLLKDIDKISDLKELQVTSNSNKKKARKSQNVDCLKVERLSLVLTQFRPYENKIEQLEVWREFMKMTDTLMEEAKLHKFLIEDKDEQKRLSDAISRETNENMGIVNSNICMLMAKILGVHPDIKRIKKEDLKKYQANTTIDLLLLHQEVLQIYEQQLLMGIRKSIIHQNILNYFSKKYEI